MPELPSWLASILGGDQSSGLLPGQTPLPQQVAQNPVGTQATWRTDPYTGQPAQSVGQGSIGEALYQGDDGQWHLTPHGKDVASMGLNFATFGGKGAKTADLSSLDEAQRMYDKGHAMGEIWATTGWTPGLDGKWRFEINDQAAKLTGSGFRNNPFGRNLLSPSMAYDGPDKMLLGQVLDHPELYKAYPDLANTYVTPTPLGNYRSLGGYDSTKNQLYIAGGEPDKITDVMLHEIQHGIQDREGFAQGGNTKRYLPSDFEETRNTELGLYDTLNKKFYDNGLLVNPFQAQYALKRAAAGQSLDQGEESILNHLQANPQTLNQLQDWTKLHEHVAGLEQDAYTQYSQLPGEVEARNVEKRRLMAPTSRLLSPPWRTEDVSRELQAPKSIHISPDILNTPEGISQLRGLLQQGYTTGNHTADRLEFLPP